MLPGVVLFAAMLAVGAPIATAAPAASGDASIASAPDLRAIHDALFDAYFPAAQLPLPDSLRRLVPVVREGLWRRFEAEPSIQATLEAFAHLDRLAASTPSLAGALPPGVHALSDLAPTSRDSSLALLLASDDATARRLASGTRMLYLRAIYGSELGLRIARARSTPVLHPDVAEFTKSHQPRLPASTLRYDRERRELRARSGGIDDIVVGSGPAGSVIATELRRAGRRVLLIDQGPFVIPGAMNSRKPPELIESGGRRSSASGSVFFNNGQAVGGGSTVNIDLAFAPTLPIVRRRIEAWRNDGRIGPEVTPEAVRNAYAWVRQRVGTRTPGTSEINPNNQVLWDGARRQGLTPDLYDLNTFPPGAWQSPVSDKRSAVSGFLLQALQQSDNPLQLLPDARVLEILLDRGTPRPRATGVRFVVRAPWNAPGVWPDPLGLGMTVGDTVTVQASRVIICAGTLGSAALLLRSGIANPNIGAGIVAHPAMPVIGQFDHRIDNQLGTIATVFVDDMASSRKPCRSA